MKTDIFVPSFYLAHPEQTLKINKSVIIGRSKGDVVLEDDTLLSSIHCEVRTKLLQAFIKDLNSRNGVFVNKVKIDPGVEVLLNSGDLVQIGSFEYTFFDNELDAKKLQPKESRRKHPRPENLYGFINLINFYSAPYSFRGIYLIVILATIVSFALNLQINIPIPEKLNFLANVYNDQIIFSGIKLIFLVWFLSLLHSFLIVIYFNRNPLRKGISLIAYILAVYLLVDFRHGPLGGIKSYITDRENLESLNVSNMAIVNLKNTLDHKEALSKSYKSSRSKITEENYPLLDKDYKEVVSRLDTKIMKLK